MSFTFLENWTNYSKDNAICIVTKTFWSKSRYLPLQCRAITIYERLLLNKYFLFKVFWNFVCNTWFRGKTHCYIGWLKCYNFLLRLFEWGSQYRWPRNINLEYPDQAEVRDQIKSRKIIYDILFVLSLSWNHQQCSTRLSFYH